MTASNRACTAGVEQLRVAAAGRDRGDVGEAQHVEDVRAPDQRVALDVPMIERRAHRGENVGGVELGGDVRAWRGAVRRSGRHDRFAGARIVRTVSAHGRLFDMGCSPQMATADGRFARETIGDTLKKSEISRPNWIGAAARGLRAPGSKRFDRLNPA
jgi:hypothetical protein